MGGRGGGEPEQGLTSASTAADSAPDSGSNGRTLSIAVPDTVLIRHSARTRPSMRTAALFRNCHG